MKIGEDKCLDAAAKKLESYGMQNITPVRMGIYANSGNYNIFVGCNSDVGAIFIVASGPENSHAKKLRESIKDFIP